MRRIEITEKASKVLDRLMVEFRKRKIPKQEWHKIFSEAITAHGQEFWDTQTEKYTPHSYLIEMAILNPKMQKEIQEFIRSKLKSGNELNEDQGTSQSHPPHSP